METIKNDKQMEDTITNNVRNDEDNTGVYARVFDDGCPGWMNDSEASRMFLKLQQQYANDLLRRRGYLFLNDVYEMLGIPRSKAGQLVGWFYDVNNEFVDNEVIFDIYTCHSDNKVKFIIDFNVDGSIIEKLPD